MPYTEINGINIHYEVRGSGAPLSMMEECLEGCRYHDVPVADQTPDRVRQWIIEFLESHSPVAAA